MASAQKINDNSRYLYIIISSQGNGGFAMIDTLIVTKDSGNQTEFSAGKGFSKEEKQVFLKDGDSIYIITNNDTSLIYDYSLEAGDTFNYMPATPQADKFIVDSVNIRLLEDGKLYKHWYLHTLASMANFPIIWIENLGEKYSGWDYTTYNIFHTPALESICYDNQILLWNNVMQLDKTCDFDSIVKTLGVDKLYGFKPLLYPNPCIKFLQVSLNQDFHFVIYDLSGKVISEGFSDGKIDTEHLPEAVYILHLFNAAATYHFIFEKTVSGI